MGTTSLTFTLLFEVPVQVFLVHSFSEESKANEIAQVCMVLTEPSYHRFVNILNLNKQIISYKSCVKLGGESISRFTLVLGLTTVDVGHDYTAAAVPLIDRAGICNLGCRR